MNVKRWLHEHSLKLLAIRDTPEAIAGGVAIGLFFGFTPLFGLKTVCAIFFAWLTRSNIIRRSSRRDAARFGAAADAGYLAPGIYRVAMVITMNGRTI